MNFNFGEVLTRAWQIVWKHKVLWIFGILASCGRGGSNLNPSGNNVGGGNGGFGNPPNIPPQVERYFEWIVNNVTTFLVIVFSLACIIWIITIFLGTIGRIGLVRGTAQAEGSAESLIFGQLFSESMPYFWRVFGLSIIPGLPILIPIAAIFVVAVMTLLGPKVGDGSALPEFGLLAAVGPLAVGCACLLLPVIIVLNLVIYQAERAVVLDDASFLASIARGWDVFRNNLGPIIVMAIILFVITLVTGFIIRIPILIAVVPAVFAFVAGNGQSSNPLILALICVCLYTPVYWLLNGMVIAYAESAWTLTYMRLTRKPDSNNIVTPPSETPPSMDDPDKTMISSSHA